jgi:starch phosphorylase
MGFSPEWVKMAKRSIMTLLPQFNSQRMVGEYLTRFYIPSSQRHRRFVSENFALARELAQWKRRVRDAWPKVALRPMELPARHATFGDKVRFSVAVQLGGLEAKDVAVELLVGDTMRELRVRRPPESYTLHPEGGRDANGEQRYALDLAPELCGKLEYRIRAYPNHPALAHRFQMGLMKWL